MLSRKYRFIALALLVFLTGLVSVSAQTQQKPKKYKEILTEGPRPEIRLAEHATIITPCPESPADAVIPLTATVANYTTTPLRYSWRVSGGKLTGEGPNASWDLTGVTPGTYSARVEVDNNRDDGCTAFTSTKIVVRPCPPPVLCPNITISAPDTVPLNAPATFTATVNGGTPGVAPVYNWTVTAGTIISGQGTTSITVDTNGLGGQGITANLSVEGYKLNCATGYTVQVERPKISAIMCDEYGPLKRDDEKARLDNCSIAVQNDPSAKFYVVLYSTPNAKAAAKQARIKRITDYLTTERHLDISRITIVDGGTRDVQTTKIWIVPLGADLPSTY